MRVVHIDLDRRAGGGLPLGDWNFSRGGIAVILAGIERDRDHLQSAMDPGAVIDFPEMASTG